MATFQTREQMLEARKIAERAEMQKRLSAAPTAAAYRETDGVRIKVTNPTPNMTATLDEHGFGNLEYKFGVNCRERICTTPADLTAVQNALRGFFGREIK